MALRYFSCPKGDWVEGAAINDPANRPVILVGGSKGVNQRLGNIQNCRQRGLRAAIAPAPSSAIGRLEREATMKLEQPRTTPRRAAQQAARISFTPTTGGAARAQQQAVAQFSLGGLFKGIGRGIAGVADKVIPGGGAIADALLPGDQGFSTTPIPFHGGGGLPSLPGRGLSGCGPGLVKVGDRCLDITAALPGGRPFTQPAMPQLPGQRPQYGAAVMGAFNMPALEPAVEMRPHRSCPPGMVLGKDDLCYPKQILGKRNRFRKWRGEIAPPITRAQMKAISQADKAKNKVKELAPKVGLKATNR